MYLVDTNVVAEARRGRAEPRRWLASVDPRHVYLSVVTLGEIRKGVAMKARSDPNAAQSIQLWLDRLRLDHAGRILPVDDEVAIAWGRLAAIRPRGMAAALIAATAEVHGMTVVTRNVADFADLASPVLNPWAADT